MTRDEARAAVQKALGHPDTPWTQSGKLIAAIEALGLIKFESSDWLAKAVADAANAVTTPTTLGTATHPPLHYSHTPWGIFEFRDAPAPPVAQPAAPTQHIECGCNVNTLCPQGKVGSGLRCSIPVHAPSPVRYATGDGLATWRNAAPRHEQLIRSMENTVVEAQSIGPGPEYRTKTHITLLSLAGAAAVVEAIEALGYKIEKA